MSFDLKAKTAIVTGASSGIGRSLATTLAQAGASVLLVGRDEGRLTEVRDEIGDVAVTHPADLSDVTQAQRVHDAAVEAFGTVDIVLSNAGLYVGGDFAETDVAELEQVTATNVTGALAIVRAALPDMIARRHGDVLLTSSVAGHQAIHWEPVYSASKHAVQAFVHAVRRQLVGTGVRIGAVAPGVVLNELWGFGPDEVRAKLDAGEGLTSEDVADAVLYMLTRPRHVNIRDLVILPSAQEI